ncbi:hypothetical protein Tco_0125239 [Tanacetum coccineum]
MSSPNHPTSDIEDAFSFNFSDYTPTSPDYFPVTLGNISPDPSDNLSKYLLASLAILPFHDDPYMQAYNAAANEPPIPPQAPIDPRLFCLHLQYYYYHQCLIPEISFLLKRFHHLKTLRLLLNNPFQYLHLHQ